MYNMVHIGNFKHQIRSAPNSRGLPVIEHNSFEDEFIVLLSSIVNFFCFLFFTGDGISAKIWCFCVFDYPRDIKVDSKNIYVTSITCHIRCQKYCWLREELLCMCSMDLNIGSLVWIMLNHFELIGTIFDEKYKTSMFLGISFQMKLIWIITHFISIHICNNFIRMAICLVIKV